MAGLFQRIVAVLRQNRDEIIGALLMVLMGFGLLFGDGKQGLIEVYGVISTLFLWFFRLYVVKRSVRPLPPSLRWTWFGVVSAVLLSTLFSIDIGYSISWMIRLLSGYLLFRLFFDCSSRKLWNVLANGLLIFTGFSVVISLLWVFPWFKRIIPSMSLVGMQYGHNHLVDLLVLITPLLYIKLRPVPLKKSGALYVVFWLLVGFTRARAAWAILLVYTIVYGARAFSGRTRLVFFTLFFSVVIAFSAYGVGLYGMRPGSVQVRLGYWIQAIDGFLARPLLGNGPGTFSLVSYRYQRFDQEASWFAHNQVLETLSELGMVGSGALVLFLGMVFLTWKKRAHAVRDNEVLQAFSAGVVLIFLYGIVEYVLDYFVIWLLVWTLLGLVCGALAEPHDTPSSPPWASMSFILIFYILWVLGNGVGLLISRPDISFLLAPFDAPLSLSYVSGTNTHRSSRLVSLATVFHRGNPEILFEASLYYSSLGNTGKAREFMKMAVFQNPQNMTYVSRYLVFLSSEEPEQAGRDYIELLTVGLPKPFASRAYSLMPFARHIGEIIIANNKNKPFLLQERYASLLYDVGLEALKDEPILTKTLWELARDIYPDLSSLHIELARFYLHVDLNEEKARAVLTECTRYPSPRKQCEIFLRTKLTEFDLLPPGDYSDALN